MNYSKHSVSGIRVNEILQTVCMGRKTGPSCSKHR